MKTKALTETANGIVKGVYFIIPFAICGGTLVTLSYIVDFISGTDAAYGLGSDNPFAVVLKALGTLTFGLMLPVLSSVTAVNISEKGAFLSGLVGGFISQNGATVMLPYGDTSAVSGFIGAVFAGVAAGFAYKGIKRLFSSFGDNLRHHLNNLILPISTVLVIGTFMLCVNPLISILNTGLSAILTVISTANPVAFGAVLGIMTAIDMGGAFSKAALIFATAAIASGEYTAMAAVAAAGMTISLSIALSAVVFKDKFTKKEAELAKANLLFGLCNITEGAIPIAAKSPARVIPACALGAAVSGGLSAGFGCTLIAPYGGIFVLPLVGNPLLFVLSVFAGTVAGAVFLGIFKKEPKNKFNTEATDRKAQCTLQKRDIKL